MAKLGVVARWRQFFPVGEKTPIVSLGEGDTPLIRMPSFEQATGVPGGLGQVRWRQPHRFLQGSGDGPGHEQGA